MNFNLGNFGGQLSADELSRAGQNMGVQDFAQAAGAVQASPSMPATQQPVPAPSWAAGGPTSTAPDQSLPPPAWDLSKGAPNNAKAEADNTGLPDPEAAVQASQEAVDAANAEDKKRKGDFIKKAASIVGAIFTGGASAAAAGAAGAAASGGASSGLLGGILGGVLGGGGGKK